MPSQVFSGARARLSVDGNIIGFTGAVSGSETVTYEPVETIEFLEIREHVPVGYGVTLNTQFFRIVGDSLKQRGIFPSLENILTSGAITVAVQDTQTGLTPLSFEQARIAEKNFDVTPRGIVSDSCTWVAIRGRDESGT